MKVIGQLVDIANRRIYAAEISISETKISRITPIDKSEPLPFFILPGFIDAHVHIESSMLIPAEFARLAVVHGTVATVSDPHEIANVCGKEGVAFMVDNGKSVPFKFNFGVPSCVPATSFETAGDAITAEDVKEMISQHDFLYLSEMMNFPGVLNNDFEVMAKIEYARAASKPVDGHAPGLTGEAAQRYINAGISTDHECFTEEEALGKLEMGMKVIIREGSAAKNFEALVSLIDRFPGQMMFCSDDKHPDSLVTGHINALCERALSKGCDLFKVLQAACITPVDHYKLNVGLLREGDPADFILVEDLSEFKVHQTFINGQLVAEDGAPAEGAFDTTPTNIVEPINRFNISAKKTADFALHTEMQTSILVPVIEALDGQLITNKLEHRLTIENGQIQSDPANDILKIVVVNRYFEAPVAKAFIKNFSLKRGAIASSVAHDSHNIVAVGINDESICEAVNLVISSKGGVSAVIPGEKNDFEKHLLPLPVAGLMSASNGYEVASAYTLLDAKVKEMGSTLAAPFMTLSFMALLVIPHLKLSDLGLFDGDDFKLV